MKNNTLLFIIYTILITFFIPKAYAAITPYQQVADLQEALTQGERKIYQPLVLNQRKNDATLGQKVFCWARAAYNAQQLYKAAQKIDNWNTFDLSQFSSLESLTNETIFNQWVTAMRLQKRDLALPQSTEQIKLIINKFPAAIKRNSTTIDIASQQQASSSLTINTVMDATAAFTQFFENVGIFIPLDDYPLTKEQVQDFQHQRNPKIILLLYSGFDDLTHRYFNHWLGIVMTPAGMVVTESYGNNEGEALSSRNQTNNPIILALYDLMVGKPSTKTAAIWKQKVQELIKQTYREYKAKNHLQAQITFKLAYEALQNEGGKSHEFIEQYFTQNFYDHFNVDDNFDRDANFFTDYLAQRLKVIAMDQPSLTGHKKEATSVDNLATLQSMLGKLKKGVVALKEKLQSSLQALGTLKQKLSELSAATK